MVVMPPGTVDDDDCNEHNGMIVKGVISGQVIATNEEYVMAC